MEIHHAKIEEYDSRLDLRLRMLINEFDRFTKTRGIFINRVDIPSILSKFIYENAVEMNSFFKYNSDLGTTVVTNNQFEKVIVEFLLRERSSCSDCYSFIEEIYSGAVISSLLQLGRDELLGIEDDPFNIEDALLDSNFIFRLLDLQTGYEHEASLETLKLLKDNHCRLWVSPATVKQISDTITAFTDDISPFIKSYHRYIDENRFSGLYSAYIRRGLTPAKLQEIKDSLNKDTLEKDYQISIFDQAITDEKSIKIDEISSLHIAKPSSSSNGIIHDLQIILTVRNQRDSMITRMDQAKWWVLTDDYKLTKWCHSKRSKTTIPECLTESQLATLYWLKNPQKTSTTGLCNTILALRNRDLFNSVEYKKITEEIESQKRRFEKSPRKLDRLALAFSSRCLSLDDLVSVEPDKADELFDSKLAEADSFVQNNQTLIKEQTSLQETAKLFELQLEQVQIESGDKSAIIRDEIKKHLDTLRLLSAEKVKIRDRVQVDFDDLIIESQKAKKSDDNVVVFMLVIACILVIGFTAVIELRTKIFTSIQELLPVTFSVFFACCTFLIAIKIGANSKAQIPSKLFKKISSFIYSTKVFKNRRFDYEVKIKETKEQLDSINLEIVSIEDQIEEKLILLHT